MDRNGAARYLLKVVQKHFGKNGLVYPMEKLKDEVGDLRDDLDSLRTSYESGQRQLNSLLKSTAVALENLRKEREAHVKERELLKASLNDTQKVRTKWPSSGSSSPDFRTLKTSCKRPTPYCLNTIRV